MLIPPRHPGIFPPATFVARVDAPAESHLFAIRDTIRSVDADVPVFSVKTMQQRLNELGRMVLGEAFLTVCVGIIGGAPLIFWIKRLAGSLMGSAPGSLTAPIALGALAILAVALVAAYIPARRAMRVDPMVALRYE